MTRLPSDSFLPSGAMEAGIQLSLAGPTGTHNHNYSHDLSPVPSSVISPLTLPRGTHYFETTSRQPANSTNHAFPHTAVEDSRDPPRAQPASFLSPHLRPIPSHAQHQIQYQRFPQQRASSLSPTRGPASAGRRVDVAMDRKIDSEISPPQKVSSGVSVPVTTISGTGSGLITVRRPAMRTAGIAEVTAANPQASAAEQEYRKLERLRQAFDDERRYLQASRDRAEEVYREIIDELEEDHARERSRWEADKYELQTQIMQLQHRLDEAESRGNGAPPSDPKLSTFQSPPVSQISPSGRLIRPSPPPRDRLSSDSSTTMDFEFGQPSKVIDVQEYHKDLEGIHLKENFVKKETFTDTPSSSGSRSSSGRVSPPQANDNVKSLARARSLRVLKADADSRLTMHAGHTPTISLSIANTGASNTVVSSGSNTPTLTSGDGAMSDDNRHESFEPAEPAPTGVEDDDEPAILEPSDEDPELKGPLTLRNMPAKDEAFLSILSDKLEKVTSGEDATPTVLKHSDDEDDGEVGDDEAVEEIPLKLKNTTSNFGKPFGMA